MTASIKVTNKGLDLITAALLASTLKYIGWGTGTTAANVTDTALETPAAPARTAGTQSQVQTTVTKDTYQVEGTVVAAAPIAISEIGLFDGAGSGSPPTGANLGLRAVLAAAENLVAGEGILWTIKIAFVSA